MITVDLWALAIGGTLLTLIAAIGLGHWWLGGHDVTRLDAANDRLQHDLATALRTLAGNGVEHHGALAEMRGALAAQHEDLIEAARRIKRHAIARRNAEERLAGCRCHWLADEPTVDLGTADALAAQFEEYLAQQRKDES